MYNKRDNLELTVDRHQYGDYTIPQFGLLRTAYSQPHFLNMACPRALNMNKYILYRKTASQ
jgi:hypothetical protein